MNVDDDEGECGIGGKNVRNRKDNMVMVEGAHKSTNRVKVFDIC